MKITKQQLKKLIKEELALVQEHEESYDPREGAWESEVGAPEASGDPDMSTGWKLDRILEILEKAPFAPPK